MRFNSSSVASLAPIVSAILTPPFAALVVGGLSAVYESCAIYTIIVVVWIVLVTLVTYFTGRTNGWFVFYAIVLLFIFFIAYVNETLTHNI